MAGLSGVLAVQSTPCPATDGAGTDGGRVDPNDGSLKDSEDQPASSRGTISLQPPARCNPNCNA
jgi:hypothetical protein